jgi:hypothetical protein
MLVAGQFPRALEQTLDLAQRAKTLADRTPLHHHGKPGAARIADSRTLGTQPE